jgi:hypothetical protein
MSKRRRNFRRPVLGDVVEIPVKGGFAYAQYTFRHTDPPEYGDLIRVLPGIYKKPLSAFEDLVSQEERFFTFYPLGSAVRQELVRIVAHIDVPDCCKTLPIMKSYIQNLSTGEKTWWLWDGNQQWKVGKLSPAQRKLSYHGIINHAALVEYIEMGWTPLAEWD